MTEAIAPKVPVKAVFRKSPPVAVGGAVTGLLADRIKDDIEQFNAPQIMAILPYQPLQPGLKGDDMVAMLAPGGERLIVHYRTIIQNTIPAEVEDYAELLHQMTALGGYEVEAIQATNINHLLRRAEYVKGEPTPEEQASDEQIVVEEVVIEVDIVNDDLEADTGVGSDSFKEDWA